MARLDGIAPSGRSAEVAATFAPGLVSASAPERPITVDQTNYSVVVGERVVVKWLLPPVHGDHPAVRLMTHLRDVGFTEMPRFYGALVGGGATAAIVTGFVAGALDGWDWYVDELAEAASLGDVTAPLESARRLGAITGRLHRALATPSATIPQPLQVGSLAEEVDRGVELLGEAAGEPVVIPRAAAIRALLEKLAAHTGDRCAQPIHGDLHVGQILRSDTVTSMIANSGSRSISAATEATSESTTMFVNDFDGSPVELPQARLRPRSRLVDLASMLQSIDHVGRVVSNRRPDLAPGVGDFLGDAAVVALSGYRDAWGADEPIDLSALFTLSIIQELHEFVYARRSLPRWSYVPEAALAALLPH